MPLMATWGHKVIDLEEGWDVMQRGITKVINIIEGLPEHRFSSEEYMMFYGTIYHMYYQVPPFEYTWELYDKYRETFEEYIISTVLPSLREKHGEVMLSELVKRWSNHGVMVKWLSRFFNFLERYFIPRRSLPSLPDVANTCFRDLVYQEFNAKVRDAVISLINKEREGEQIDRDLLKNVLKIFIEIGKAMMDYYNYYENDFEEALLKDTAAYYSQKASTWILEEDYMSKVEECLKREKDMVAHYLHPSSETKLLEIVQHELLSVYGAEMREEGAL